ncbi:tip elongation aberrant protein 1-like [Teratosphaeria destructans]|uniref:Tip elongation aberrant protein 1-like n=1 Tax=Teratosphaeria destructans TaxID=418781 RepID=A0A9W7VZ40_9PEZI|nr:tip elongation aberrant protein 1-like [Teratosphaeria destructans]
MSFLFKSSKKGGPPNTALPPATRDIRSSDGPNGGSQVPQPMGGVVNGQKPASPSPPSVSNSIGSVVEHQGRMAEDKQVVQVRQQDGHNAPRRSDSPEQKTLQTNGPRMGPPPSRTPPADNNPYPWSQKRLAFTVSHVNPFPRYGPAVNASGSKDGSIYLMGGLINGSTVKGDLWLVEAGQANMTCYPVATTSEGPGPRVGHASLLVGNAFIVFGGDTKMDEGDQLDDTLYLLNTSTKQWSRALPAGPRPPGRYGHTLNILGSKIYIFGGQVEGYFFNDLVAFDLNALQQASNKWEILIQNTIDGGPPHGQIPPARTNHTIVSYNDRLYLFGGTDGVHWFNDVWSYSPQTNSWTQLECIGYIPSPREGHAAALVGDVMYIFGGRTEEGTDLGDLAAFRISSRRWYTFQNMGPSPSPRSGHSMTTVGKTIVILAGEPSSAPRDPVELGLAYLLDTGKIRYPPDSASQTPAGDRIQGTRRPSGADKNGVPAIAGGRGQPPAELMERRMNSQDSGRGRGESNAGQSRLPRNAGPGAPSPAPTGPPPQAPGQQGRPIGPVGTRQPTRTPSDRPFSPANEAERAQRFENNTFGPPSGSRESPAPTRMPTSPSFAPEPYFADENDEPPFSPRRQKPETYQPSQDPNGEGMQRSSSSRNQRSRAGNDSMDETPRDTVDQLPEQLPKVRELQQEDDGRSGPQDSGIGSSPAMGQRGYEDLARELEAVKQKNAWFASELALARKSGYHGSRTSADSPVLDSRGMEDVFADDDKPLIEALLKMRTELSRVQQTIDEQSRSAAERIAEMERQRDTAINEAVFAKAKLAGQGSPMPDGSARGTPDAEREREVRGKLATAVSRHGELSRRMETLSQELDTEKRQRQLAEETAEMAQKRAVELEQYRQQHSSELESLRTELHEARSQHRDISASHSEILAQHKLLQVDKNELSERLETQLSESQNHTSILQHLKDAVEASTSKAQMLEAKLAEERDQRTGLETALRSLKTEHEARAAELEGTQRRLKDAEELADRHRQEAESHRSAVLAGLGQVTNRDVGASSAADERVSVLKEQVEAATALMRQNQQAADTASEKLRKAEERIAGLEAYQEQASREGLSIRSQLQSIMKQNQQLAQEKGDMEQRLQSQMLETNALHVQHSSLKDILAERGINPADVRRSRALDSPSSFSKRLSTPDLQKVRELEQQLEASLKSHDEMKREFEESAGRETLLRREYEEKLTALDNDHQVAVKYLKGTEKMLSKMKQELQRVKTENGELRKKIKGVSTGEDGGELGSKRGTPDPTGEWENERESLRKEQSELKNTVSSLESRIGELQTQLQGHEQDLQQTRMEHATAQADLTTLQSTHAQARDDLDRLQRENSMLEERARDAENKVQLLLDQVEHSVDNYRRQSRMPGDAASGLTNGAGGHHQRGISSSSNATSNATSTTTGPSSGAPGTQFTPGGHSRNLSEGGDSTYSDIQAGSVTSGDDGRNSLALDSLASELDALRTHWETTNKNYRLSDKFDFERTPTVGLGNSGGFLGGPRSASAGGLLSGGTSPAAEQSHQQSSSQGGGDGIGISNWRSGLKDAEGDAEERAAGGADGGQAHAQGQAVTAGQPAGMI